MNKEEQKIMGEFIGGLLGVLITGAILIGAVYLCHAININ